MKKLKTLISIFALALFAIGSAQTNVSATQAGQFTLGVRAGGALGSPESFAGTEDFLRPFFTNPAARISTDPELNFNAVLFASYAFTNRISLQTELNVMVEQGFELFASRIVRGSDSFDINYTSLDIPLLLRFHIFRSLPMFGIMAGPHISIPIGRLEIYDNRLERYIDELAIDSALIFGLTTGIFTGIQLGPGRILGDLRFIFDFDSLQAEGLEFSRRRAVAFTVGYEFTF